MQYAFVPGRRTADDICIIFQLQDKNIAANKPIYLFIVDPEKAEEVLWWALKKEGKERAASVIYDMYMYTDIRSRMRVNGQYSEELWV